MADHLRHLSLAHKASDLHGALRQIPRRRCQDLIEIRLGTAKARSAEQKHPLARKILQKSGNAFIAGTLIGPEAHIERIRLQRRSVGHAEIHTSLRAQRLPDGLCQKFCIAGPAAEYHSVTHTDAFLS